MTDTPGTPNCYKCAWRRNIPGNCHSECKHPDITHEAITNEPIHQLMAIFAGVGRVDPIVNASGADHLNVHGNTHGVKEGWFNWPWNFDPIWLETCNGFTPKREACKTCEASLLCVVNDKEPTYTGYNSQGQAVTKKRVRARRGVGAGSNDDDNLPEPPECWKDHERDKGSAYENDYTEPASSPFSKK